MSNLKEQFVLKGTHIIASILLIVISIVVILGMLFIRHDIVTFKPYLEFHVTKPLLLLLFGSILLIAAGFLGIFSAIHDWRAGIQIFVFVVSILLMSMIGLSAVLSLTSHNADEALRSRLIEHVGNYTFYSDEIDKIQSYFLCCGVDNSTDYNRTLDYIPGSCCASDFHCDSTNVVNFHFDGCFKGIKSLLNHCIQKLIIVLVVLGSVEIVSIILSSFFINILMKEMHAETRSNATNNNAVDSVQKSRRTSSPSEHMTSSSHSDSSSVFEKTPVRRYELPLCNYVRQPIERNSESDFRNSFGRFHLSPP